MTKAFISIIFMSVFLLAGCGNSGKETKNTQDSTQNAEGTTGNETAKTPAQILTQKWKESAEDMMPKTDSSKYTKFELEQLKEDYNNSFFEFKADGSYTITRPDEDPGNGQWTLSKDGKVLTLKPSVGDTSQKALTVEELTAKKVKLKYEDGAMLVLIPAKGE
ncbi:hypothetical protein BKI52_09330 [marine bacterium AO1-C]|nr:hypothetical protein BKI52_09330 [marine bacterium AO1-C]